MLALLGAGLLGAGYGLSAYGEQRGATRLAHEAKRQSREQMGFDNQRFDSLDQYAMAHAPGQAIDPMTAEQMQVSAGAIEPSAQAGGEALGVRPSHAFNPQLRAGVAMHSMGARAEQNDLEQSRLGLQLDEIERQRLMAQALYDGRLARAGRHGHWARQLGGLSQSLGMAGISMGMGQERQPSSGASMPESQRMATNAETGTRATDGMRDPEWARRYPSYGRP